MVDRARVGSHIGSGVFGFRAEVVDVVEVVEVVVPFRIEVVEVVDVVEVVVHGALQKILSYNRSWSSCRTWVIVVQILSFRASGASGIHGAHEGGRHTNRRT